MNPQKLLVLETSERTGQVGLAENGILILEQKLDGIKRRSSDLAEVVQLLLSQIGWTPKNLSGVVVGQGPGSFTGLRVGIVSAKVLAYSLKIPLYAIPTFETIVFQSPVDVQRVSVIADALQKKVFMQTFERDDLQTWSAVEALKIETFEAWKANITPNTFATGPGLSIKGIDLAGLSLLDEEVRLPMLATMVRQVKEYPERYAYDVWKVEPIYARGSSAEEKLEQTKHAGAEDPV